MEKTEAALAKFHAENLCHLLPDLRPDKFPIELWALTSDELKQSANEAWEIFSDERLKEVIPELMAIDISKDEKNLIFELRSWPILMPGCTQMQMTRR